jgi:DNA-binding HxlR family transcriptional regulator
LIAKNNQIIVKHNLIATITLVPTRRTYADACPIARALDVVGERWALLVVRELLLGALRFSDLRRALPNASSNLIADRLHELEDRGVIDRRQLPPPAGSWVYELTDWGQALEPIVLGLGDWGARIPLPPEPRVLSPASAVLFLESVSRPDPDGPPIVGRLELDGRVWTIEAAGGRLRADAREPAQVDFALRGSAEMLVALVEDPDALDAMVADGSVAISGDPATLRRVLLAAATSARTERSAR